MELNEDLVMDIISHLPVKLAIQCKILCKSINNKLCEPKVIQSYALRWFQDQNISKQLIYSSSLSKYNISKVFCNASISRTSVPLDVSVLASCKGLLFLEFHQAGTFCIFNPTTGAHQLIPYPEPRKKIIEGGGEGLVVDYPNSGLYKLVTVRKLDEHLGHKFHVFSSQEPGELWHEFQLRPKFGYASLVGQPAYVHDCLHWLRIDGKVLVFDTTRGHEARIINFPEVIKRYVKDPLYGIISFLFDEWLGTTQGVLTLVCAFKKLIVIFTYDYVRSNWTVSHTLANFSPDLGCLGHGFPMWFDGEKLLFLVRQSSASQSGYLYEYDSEIKTYEKVHVILDMDTIKHFFSFEPTLANVVIKSTVLPYTIRAEHLRAITTALDELRCLITHKPRVKCNIERAVNKFPYIN